MPAWAEKQAAKQGGVARWRMMKKNGKTYRCMITRKEGKRGGKTICYEV